MRRVIVVLVVAWVFGTLTGCFSRETWVGRGARDSSAASLRGGEAYVEEGVASWYGGEFHGRQTANGEIFDTTDYTAAHRTLPFNTVVTVTNLDNNRRVRVRINDRGPFVPGRVIDLSRAAADALGMLATGTARVRLEVSELEIDDNPDVVLQLASYRDRANAAKLARTLQENGFRPVIDFMDGFYRVVLQQVPTDEVEEMRPKLAKLGITDFLVRRP